MTQTFTPANHRRAALVTDSDLAVMGCPVLELRDVEPASGHAELQIREQEILREAASRTQFRPETRRTSAIVTIRLSAA